MLYFRLVRLVCKNKLAMAWIYKQLSVTGTDCATDSFVMLFITCTGNKLFPAASPRL